LIHKKLTLWVLTLIVFSLHSFILGAEQKVPVHLQRPMVNPKDNPDLPNVLIIGDSISIGYTVAVRKLLDGKADVFRPATNCRYSGYGAQNVKAWIANKKWDVIHFNFGIWDTHYFHKEKIVPMQDLGNYQKEDLRRRYTHKQYVENLKKVLDAIKQTKAKLIWASATPFVSYGEDTKVFLAENNNAAAKLMKDNGVMLNDLYTLALPNLKEWQLKDGCHFNSKGYQKLAKQVASSISEALSKKAKDSRLIVNDTDWKDTTGKLIAAHEGDIARFNGVFYWYGSSYANNPKGRFRMTAGPVWNGVQVYSSTDLKNWTYKGTKYFLSRLLIGFLVK
jgi:lysophospholipase L1-like esterase